MIKVIACKVFETYIKDFISDDYDIVYLNIQLHNQPKKLNRLIQQEINQSQNYEKILLLYGLCGNMLLDIYANEIPLIVIRAHDCLSILLGGHHRYLEQFEDRKSSSWTCRGLIENKAESNLKDYQQWIIDYGIEEADYLKSVLYTPCHIYIKMEDTDNNSQYEETLTGDINYLKDILNLNNKDLITLLKNEKLKLTNDNNVIEKYGIG